MKRRVTFTFPEELIRESIIYNLGQQFRIVTNIYQADISANMSWMVLELEGEEEEIEEGIAWVTSRGVRATPVVDDIVEGRARK